MKKYMIILMVIFLTKVAVGYTAGDIYQDWLLKYGELDSYMVDYNLDMSKTAEGFVIFDHMKILSKGSMYNWETTHITDPNVPRTKITTYDNVLQKIYKPDWNVGSIYEATRELESTRQRAHADYYTAGVLTRNSLTNTHSLHFMGYPDLVNLGTKTISINGENVTCAGFTQGGKEAWFAVHKDMTLVKYTNTLNNFGLDVKELGLNEDGYYPKQGRIRRKDILIDFDVIDFRRNPICTAESFSYQFPVGCRVKDHQTGAVYTVK